MDNSFFKKFDNLDLGIPKKGKFLISEPFLPDPNFSRSVIFLTDHSEKGSVGFVLNKKLDIPINEAIENFPDFDGDLFIGGPVENSSLFYLHTLGDKLPGSHLIMDNLYWGGEFDSLKVLLDTKQVTSEQVRFFTGYSGWSAGQLETEMKQRSWIVANATVEQVMNQNIQSLWKDILSGLGANYAMMTKFPADPSLN